VGRVFLRSGSTPADAVSGRVDAGNPRFKCVKVCLKGFQMPSIRIENLILEMRPHMNFQHPE